MFRRSVGKALWLVSVELPAVLLPAAIDVANATERVAMRERNPVENEQATVRSSTWATVETKRTTIANMFPE